MHSIWESQHFHREPDLVVIGAGIVGSFTALFHKRAYPHHHVVVVERGPFPSGASVKNAGFACFGSPSELLADIDNEGADAMLQRVEERWKGLLELREELGDDAIGFETTGGNEVYASHDPLYTRVAERFDDLNTQLRPIFGRLPFIWANDMIKTFGLASVDHLVRTDLEGPIDTGRMMAALLMKVQAEGVLFRPNTTVIGLEEGSTGVRIALGNGDRIAAGQVIVATNGYANDLLPGVDVRPARGQVLLSAPVPGLKLKGTFHYDEGFVYFRDLNGCVLLGGARNLDIEGETTSTEGTTPVIQAELERILREVILPGRTIPIAKRWSGTMAMGSSKGPLVERISPRISMAVRMGGMGVAIGIRVARQAAALLE